MATNTTVANKLGFDSPYAFKEWIKGVSDLAYELERLAPQLAANGPNPEYPWPRHDPVSAPVEHDFQAWRHIQTANGRHLWLLIDQILANFDEWF